MNAFDSILKSFDNETEVARSLGDIHRSSSIEKIMQKEVRDDMLKLANELFVGKWRTSDNKIVTFGADGSYRFEEGGKVSDITKWHIDDGKIYIGRIGKGIHSIHKKTYEIITITKDKYELKYLSGFTVTDNLIGNRIKTPAEDSE